MLSNREKKDIFRILDAAINRTAEGLRVIEDHLRMARSNGFLAKETKQLRHDVASFTDPIATSVRLNARDTINDVGRENQTDTEYARTSIASILTANFARVQQSLRTIEEYAKPLDPAVAEKIESIRYRSYTLEKAVLQSHTSGQRLKDDRIYVLVDGEDWKSSPQRFAKKIESLVAAGVDLIQFRDKSLTGRDQVRAGKIISQSIASTGARWIMNDRADLAVAAGADGVHFGQDDLTVAQGRSIVGADQLIGISTHCIDQARQAVLDGADYIGVGPIFSSTTKQFDQLAGIAFAGRVADEIQLPAFAIGGIDLNNIQQIADSGMTRVAIAGAITNAPSHTAIVETIKNMKATLRQPTSDQNK